MFSIEISGGLNKRARGPDSPTPGVIKSWVGPKEKSPLSNLSPIVIGNCDTDPINGSRICPPCV